MSRLAKVLPYLYFLIDVFSISLSYYVVLHLQEIHLPPEEVAVQLMVLISLWYALAYISKLYRSNLHNGVWLRLRHYIKNHLYFATHILLIKFCLPDTVIPGVYHLLIFIGSLMIANLTTTFVVIGAISRFRRRQENIKDTLIIGVGEAAIRITNYLDNNPDFGFRVSGYISAKADDECRVDPAHVFGTLENLDSFLDKSTISEIIIALPYNRAKSKKIKKIIEAADRQGARINYVPDYQGLFGKDYETIQDSQLEAVKVRTMPLDGAYPTLEKGIFDFVFALGVLIALSPIFLILAILIKADSRGPVFYCPVRVGRGGKNFKLYKFRTMSENDSELGGTKSTQKNDPRITRIGKTLRKYNLDELPQFINVLQGDMSVVGPRPHRNYLNEKMKEHVDKYMLRHYFRPGITGWAQVNGWRGPTETEEQIAQRTAHDLWYIQNWSFSFDLRIIWMTIFSRKARENAY